MDISTISIGSLIAIISILIIFAIVEINLHLKSLSQIPIRIHVNGARGKSSVVRLIASGLREGGFKTYAKTTGTIPRIINDNGDDVELHRLRTASIGEQIKLIRYFGKQKPDAVRFRLTEARHGRCKSLRLRLRRCLRLFSRVYPPTAAWYGCRDRTPDPVPMRVSPPHIQPLPLGFETL